MAVANPSSSTLSAAAAKMNERKKRTRPISACEGW